MTMLLLLLTVPSFADIPPPRIEKDCPIGTTLGLSAKKWVCKPHAACESAADCKPDQACEATSLCVQSREVRRSSGIKRDGTRNVRTSTITYADAACIAGMCLAGNCETVNRCMPLPEPSGPPPEVVEPDAEPPPQAVGCGCSAAGGASGSGVLMLCLLAITRRRA